MPGVSGTMSTWACSSCSIRKAHIGILQLPFFLQLEDASPTTHQATRQSKAYLLGTTCTLGLLFLPSLVSNPTNHPRPTWHLSHFPFSKPTLKVFPLKCGFWITSQRWSWTRCKQRGLKLQWWVFRPLAGEWGTGKGGRRTAGASWSLETRHMGSHLSYPVWDPVSSYLCNLQGQASIMGARAKGQHFLLQSCFHFHSKFSI